MKVTSYMLLAMLAATSINVYANAETAQKIADKYAAAAKAADVNYTGLSAEEGKTFFNREVIQFKGDKNTPGKAIACASCHTANPADTGKHIVTGKSIPPLSPVVNTKRFSSIKDVEKKFAKHCNDVVDNDCTQQEKGNYIAYLLTEKTPTKR